MDYKSALRKAGSVEQLATVSFAELSKAIGTVKLRISSVHKATGHRYLHLVDKDDNYLSVKIGPKVDTQEEGLNLVKELVTNYIVYTGENANGMWFTFGPEPGEAQETFEISIADFVKQGKIKASLVG